MTPVRGHGPEHAPGAGAGLLCIRGVLGLPRPPVQLPEEILRFREDQMSDRIKATTSEIDTIKIALDFENEGYKFYQKAVQEAQLPDVAGRRAG